MDGHFVRAMCITTSVLTVLLAVITTVSNGFLLFVLYKDPLRRLKKPVMTFITAIAVMDFLTGLLCDPVHARYEIRCAIGMNTETEDQLGGFSAVVSFFTINSATTLILIMSIERLVAVQFPYFYRRAVTRKHANATVIGVCVYFFVFAMLQLANVDLEIYETVDLYLHTVFPVLLVIVIYIAITFLLRRQRRKLTHNKANKENESSSQYSRNRSQTDGYKKERKIVFTAFLITLFLLISFLPYTVMVITAAHCQDCNKKEWFFFISRIAFPFLFSNPVANPLVFVLRMRDVRRSVKVILNRSSQQTNNNVAVSELQRTTINGGEEGQSPKIVSRAYETTADGQNIQKTQENLCFLLM